MVNSHLRDMENLNEEESKKYMEIVLKGNMDDMADFAYKMGWKQAMNYLKEEMENLIITHPLY